MVRFRIPKFDRNFFHSIMVRLLWLFLLVFPKGGFKVAGVPLTWGYFFLGIASLFVLSARSWTVSVFRVIALLCLVPFQIVSLATLISNGVEGTFGWALAFLITFLFLPFIFLFLLSNQIESINIKLITDLIRKGVTFVSYYGIFLFIYKQTTGKFLEIPFLVVNLGDLGTLDDFKCNSRGVVSKLISTYNNGQLFGISMIMLLPLYCYVQKNPWNRLITKLALLLTLSRTTWIGLLLNEVLLFIYIKKIKFKSIFYLTLGFSFLVIGVFGILSYYDIQTSFLFDESLGGRHAQLESALQGCSWISHKPFGGIVEMTYMGMLDAFGLIGLLTYLVAMAGPLVFYPLLQPSKIRACILIGLINYLVISFSDGATLYIPVLAFYWFLMSLLMRKNLNYEEVTATLYPR